MRLEAPGSGHDARPPHRRQHAAGLPGASVRPTARTRPVVPVTLDDRPGRFSPADPYVRRFWVAAIGAGAVAELLRMIRAAEKGEDVRLPRSLPGLIRAGLARIDSSGIIVAANIPEVPQELRWRFPPSLAAEHNRWLGSASGGQPGHESKGHHLPGGEGNRHP